MSPMGLNGSGMSGLAMHGVELTPARVICVGHKRVQVLMGDDAIWAELALAVPRVLAVGDHVLVIRQDANAYVIGVLHATAPVVIAVESDLSLHAPAGKIECTAGKGVAITSTNLDVVVQEARFFAKSIVERFTSATRAVKGMLITKAGTSIHSTEGEHRLTADRVTSLSKGPTRIDGKTIHLG
jgi:hypothetical protein